MNLSAMKVKLERHKAFISRKRAELEQEQDIYKASLRNLRLLRLDNKVMQMVLEYNKAVMLEAFSVGDGVEETTGGNETMKENNNLQKQLEIENSIDREANTRTKLAISAIATAVKAGFQKDIVKEMVATVLKDESEQDFIDFPVNVHDGTGITRLQELYIHLNSGWEIERIQDNTEMDNHFYFTLVRDENSSTEGTRSETKHMIEPADLNEIMELLEHGSLAEAPYIVNERLSNGEEVPKEVTREFYIKFHVDIALERIYDLLGNYDGDEE